MADTAFDTLEAARRLESAGIQAERADAIVEVVNQSTGQMVTVDRFEAAAERFDAAVAGLHARIDSIHSELSARINSVQSELSARIDSVHSDLKTRIDSIRSELRAELFRSQLISAGILVATMTTLMVTVFSILLANGAFGTVTFGTP